MLKLGILIGVIGIVLLAGSFWLPQSSPAQPQGSVVTPSAGATAVLVDEKLAGYGEQLFLAKGCATCHYHAAVAAEQGFNVGGAPNLSTYKPDMVFLRRWLKDPSAVRPGTQMPTLGISPDEIEALGAFLTARSSQGALQIRGPGLQGTVLITDTDIMGGVILEQFVNYNGGNILPPKGPSPNYYLEFMFKNRAGSLVPYDAVSYYPNSEGRPGFFFDPPDPNDYQARAADNWFLATPFGDAGMQRVLRKAGVDPNQLKIEPSPVTLDAPLPAQVAVPQALTIGFTVKATSKAPAETLTVNAQHTESRARSVYVARSDRPGHYQVSLYFPLKGQWYWIISGIPDAGEQYMPLITVVP